MDRASNVINLPYHIHQAFSGRYFIGHTPLVTLDVNLQAWVALVNPADSNVNVYLSTFTVSNYNDFPVQAMVWLAAAPRFGYESRDVAVTNRTILPHPSPLAKVVYATNKKSAISEGTSIYPRIVGPFSTAVSDDDGKIVLPPDCAVILSLTPLEQPRGTAAAAFGWWEEQRRRGR
ncbi:MAG TPA: DUF6143 family protein [Candidatus Acidoferrum sp.]|nr:DUF6143 family protein [Candidatus Acidoferrum sp.]